MKNIIRIKSISEVHAFLGIQKPKHPLVSLIPIDDDMINADYGESTYLFDFYQISLKQFEGQFRYGRNSYDFEEGSVLFLKPNQAITMESTEEMKGAKGWTLLIHPQLFHNAQLGKSIEEYSFFSYDANEALHLSEEEKENLTEVVQKIEHEYSQNIDRHSQTLILSNIELLLNYCNRYYDRQFFTRTNENKDHISRFENLLNEYFDKEKQLEHGIPTVTYCGDSLNMSGHYLSDLLKKETGMGVQEHVNNYVIQKAKNLLLSSNFSVSEIAYQLGFTYPQHFSKSFKKKTGVSPAEFRKAG